MRRRLCAASVIGLDRLRRWASEGAWFPSWRSRRSASLIVGSYRLIFEIEGADVNILGLIHGARDLAPLWGQRGSLRAMSW